MRYRLKSESVIIPGAFQFYQDGEKSHKFMPSPLARDQASSVSSFRTANSLPRSSMDESLADVIDYNAFRLGGDKRFFRKGEDETGPSFSRPPDEGGCKGCGAQLLSNE